MIHSISTKEKRNNKTVEISAGIVVVGGGMAGTCAAITAARKGVKVVLVQDRPVLWKRLKRSAALDFGRNLSHGQQQPLGT